MAVKRPRKRRGTTVVEIPAPLLQVMPEHRARLDPSVLGDLTLFLLAQRVQYDTLAKRTWSRLRGAERARRKGQIHWARMMVRAYDEVIRQLSHTVELREIDRIRDEMIAALASDCAEG